MEGAAMSSSKNKRARKGTNKRSRKAKAVMTPSVEKQVATLVIVLEGMSQTDRMTKPAKMTRKSVNAAMVSFGAAIGNSLIGDPEKRPAELIKLCLQMKAGALIGALSREGELIAECQKVDPAWVYGQARPKPKAAPKRKPAPKPKAVVEVVETPVVADAVPATVDAPSLSEGESDGALPADLPEVPEAAPEVKPEAAPEADPEDLLVETVLGLMSEAKLTGGGELIIGDMELEDDASLEAIVARIEEMQREGSAVGLVYSALTSGVKSQSGWDGWVDSDALKECRSRLTSEGLIDPLFYATNCGLAATMRLADSLLVAAAMMANGRVRSKGLLTGVAFALNATRKEGVVIWEGKELPILSKTQAAIRQTMTDVQEAIKTYREKVANNNSPKGVKGAAMSSSGKKKGADKAPKPATNNNQESAPIALPEPPPEASSVPVSTEDAPKAAVEAAPVVAEVVEAPKPKAASPTYVVSPLVARLSGIRLGTAIAGCAGKRGCNPSFKAMRKILKEWDATDPVTLDLIAFLEVVKNVHGKTHCAVTAKQARVMAQRLKVMDNKGKREAKLAAAPVAADVTVEAPVKAAVEAAPVVADAPVSVEAPKPTEAQLALEQLIDGAGVKIDPAVLQAWRASVDTDPAVITEAAKDIEALQAFEAAMEEREVAVKPEPEAPKVADSNAGASKAPEQEDTVNNGTPNEKGANAPKPAAEQPAPQPAPEVAPEPSPEPETVKEEVGFFQQIADGVVRLSNRVGDAIQGLRDASKMKIGTLALPEPTIAEAKTVQAVATSMVAYGDDLGKSEIIIPAKSQDGLLSQVIRALSTQTLRACNPLKGRVVAPAVALNHLLSGNAKSGDADVARAALEQLALHVQVRMNLAGVSVSADLEALKRAEAKAEGDVKTCLQDIIKEVAEVGCSTSRLRRTMFRVGQLEALENPTESHKKELETLRAVLKAAFEETRNSVHLMDDGKFHFGGEASKDLVGFTKELSRQLCASSLVNPDGNIHRLIDNSSKKPSDVTCAASIADAIAHAVIKVLAVKDDGVASETFIRELLFISTVQGSTVRARGGKTSRERATKGLYYIAMGSHLVVFGTVDAISWVVNALGATGKSAAYAARALYHLGLGLLTGNEEAREKARRDIRLSKSCIAQLGGSKGDGVWSVIRDHFRRARTEGKGADKRPALDAEGGEMKEHWAWTVVLSPVRLVTGAAKLVGAALSRIPGVGWVYGGIKSAISTAWGWCKGLFSKANDVKDAAIVASS